MTRLSTHVLDTSRGQPAAGVPVRLYHGDRELSSRITNGEGRCPNLLSDAQTLAPGVYRIVFDLTGYFPDGLYPEVSISFRVSAAQHFHLPLLISPFGYSTYRGT